MVLLLSERNICGGIAQSARWITLDHRQGFAAHGYGEPGSDFLDQRHFLTEFLAAKTQCRAGDARRREHAALRREYRSGDTSEAALEFLAVDGVAALPRSLELLLDLGKPRARERRVANQAVDAKDFVNGIGGQVREDGFSRGGAVSGEARADRSTHGDDGVLRVHSIEADHSIRAGHSQADAFPRAARHFEQQAMRFAAQIACFESFHAEMMELEAEAITFSFVIALDKFELFHRREQAIDRGLVEIQRGRELCDPCVRPLQAHMNEDAKRLLQRLAGLVRDFALWPGMRAFRERCDRGLHRVPRLRYISTLLARAR